MATDLKVKVGADLTGFKSGMATLPGIAKGAAIAVAAAFAVGSAAILKASKVGMEFEQTLTETATVAQAFGKDLKALENKARELGKTTAFTATEAARGMYDLASAGMSTREIVDSVEYAMKLAGATGSEMSQATHLLAATLKQFSMDASESQRITDTFAAAITNTQLTMVRLTEGMKYAGTTGASLGWAIEETTAALAQFVNLGLEGSMAGTNLRMAMISLVKQTDNMKEALSEMGLTFEQINPETHNFGEILKTLGKQSMTSAQAVAIFGARAALNMKQLSKAAAEGKGNFDELVKEMYKAQEGMGLTQQMYDRMMDTFKGRWTILKSVISDLFITLFDTFKGTGKHVFEELTEGVANLAQFIVDNQDDIKRFFEDLATLITLAAKSMMFFVENTSLLILKLKELKDQTVEGVKNTAGAIKESWNYVPQFFNDLVMAWYDLADELQKKDLATFFKEQFLTSGHEISKFVAKTKTNQESLDKIMRKLDPTYYHVIDTLIAMGNAADDTYTDWQDVSKKTTRNVISDTKLTEKELEKLDEQIRELDESIKAANANPWDPIGYDIDTGPIDKVAAAIEKATGKQYDFNKAVELGIVVEDDLYDVDYGHWYDGMSKATQMWGEFSEGAKKALEEARKEFITLEDAGKQMMEGFIESSRDLMGDVFYDVMTGKFEDINDAFSNFFDGILRKFTDLLGEMVANDILKGGLSNVLGVGLAGFGGYYGAAALGGNQASQNLAATGAMIGAQYYGGIGALVGGGIGYLGGLLFGGGDSSNAPPTYATNNADWGTFLTTYANRGDYSLGINRSYVIGGTGSVYGPAQEAENNLINAVADNLQAKLSSIPIELRKEIIDKYLYINQDLFNLGRFGQLNVSGVSAGDYQRALAQSLEVFEENAQRYLDTLARSMGKTTWEEFEKYMLKFETASQTSAQLIGDAFKAALDTGDYTFDSFKDNLYDAIFNTVRDGMINALLQSEAFRSALNPFFMQFQTAIERSTVNGIINPQTLSMYIRGLSTTGLMQNIDALEPVLNIISGALATLDAKIYGRASGGAVSRGVPYIVGEERPELFVPDTNGYIHPNTNINGNAGPFVFINRGVMTESEFFARSMRQYQDYRQGDTLQTVDVSVQGLRLG